MAYDEGLAERIRSVVDGRPGITEKKMFGGVAFLLDGKMFVGIVKNDLMVRVGPKHYAASLKRSNVRPMDFTGKPMVGYVYVTPAGIAEDPALERWIKVSAEFVTTLPAKKQRASAAKTPEKARPTRRTTRSR